jgi:hypothetical protein
MSIGCLRRGDSNTADIISSVNIHPRVMRHKNGILDSIRKIKNHQKIFETPK